MRFTSYINNQKCLEWGLNANQGALFDLLNQVSSWADTISVNGNVFYWVSRNAVIDELPLFYSKSDTVYRHFVELSKKGLIEYQKQGEKDLIRLTEKGKTWNEFSSDSNPTLGNKSELSRKQIRKSSDSNPTNNTTKDHNTNDHNNTLTGINAHTHETKKYSALVLLEHFGITERLAEDFITHRKAHKAPITLTALQGFQREADKAGIPIQQAVAIAVERGWRGFRAEWHWRDEQPKRTVRCGDNMQAEWNTPEAWAEVL